MSESINSENYPISFKAKRGKVVIRFRTQQCTISGEAGVKIAHELMRVAEKALGGKINES